MYSNAQLEFLVGSVTNLEDRYALEKVQGKTTNLQSVSTCVGFRQTADHHVRITDGLHLTEEQQHHQPVYL
jgi:hypothetical protein